MPETLLETWQRRGIDIVQGYGLTEAAPNVLCLPPEDARRKTGYAGKPYPYVTARSATRTGELLEGAAEGELVVRGPNVFAGYWRNDEATAEVFDGGWLRTGDIAERDAEGYYRIRGRLKELFISGGENVYPAEVERAAHAASRPWGTWPSSACRTSAGARSAPRSSCSRPARRRARTSCASTALRGSRATRCRSRSPSSTSCRARR